jgi:hypothetical protein
MDHITSKYDLANQKGTPAQAARRKIAREVAATYDGIARAAGFEPAERRAALAISIRLYERAGEDCEKPRGISLAAIGSALTSKSEDEEARAKTARRHVGQLFNHAIPRTGYQILTRYKSQDESGKPHEYADHLTLVAAFFSELLAEEVKRILAVKDLDRKGKREKIEETRARLIADALDYLPKCEIELVAPTGETYAYVSATDAKAYCAKNPEFSLRSFSYTPPPESEEKPKKPFFSQDFERIEEHIKTDIENKLDEIAERNSYDEARMFSKRLTTAIQRLLASWEKVAGAREQRGDEENRELNHVSDLSGVGGALDAYPDLNDPVENPPVDETPTPDNLGGVPADKPAEINDLQKPFFEVVENGPVENLPEPVPNPKPLVASVNFETSLEAALFYARDGWHVLPICQFDPVTGRCTAEWHNRRLDVSPHKACKGKVPIVKGKQDAKPGDGYTAATTDLGRIRDWYRKHPDAGVGIRLDGHVLLDCDLKDGGPDSYEVLRDTFDLPETLTAITQSGGRHYVFRLPDDLPPAWLRSWTRITAKVGIGGIDLKVGVCGLLYAEPTIGSKGVYRWIDPTVEPAILPRACCDFLHEIRYKDDKPKTKKTESKAEKTKAPRIYSSDQLPGEVDPDQAKYFRDVAPGESRHRRLYEIGCAIRANTRASADEIAKAMRYHAAHFSAPLHDETYILRTSEAIAGAF